MDVKEKSIGSVVKEVACVGPCWFLGCLSPDLPGVK